jgi:hypothetical protein
LPGRVNLPAALPVRCGATVYRQRYEAKPGTKPTIAHFAFGLPDYRDTPRAPVQNYDKEATITSLQKLKAVAAANKAQVWINHDAVQTATLRLAPAYCG